MLFITMEILLNRKSKYLGFQGFNQGNEPPLSLNKALVCLSSKTAIPIGVRRLPLGGLLGGILMIATGETVEPIIVDDRCIFADSGIRWVWVWNQFGII